MKALKIILSASALLMLTSQIAGAQDKLQVNAGADIVSKYVWRGVDQASGPSIQPTLGLSYKGVTLSAWGSTSIAELSPKEFDVSLSYSIYGLGVSLTDYWWSGEGRPYGHMGKNGDHYYEAALSYNFGCHFDGKVPLRLSVATMFAGADRNAEGRQNFATYINATYDIACPSEITLTPSLGFSSRSAAMAVDKFSCTDVSLKASKEIHITDTFSLPVFVQAIASPAQDRTYLVFGLTIR